MDICFIDNSVFLTTKLLGIGTLRVDWIRGRKIADLYSAVVGVLHAFVAFGVFITGLRWDCESAMKAVSL